MTSLSPEARALLDAARAHLTPDAAALHRVRTKVAAATGTAAAAGGTALALKLAAVVSAAAIVAGGAALALHDAPAARPPTLALASAPPAGDLAVPRSSTPSHASPSQVARASSPPSAPPSQITHVSSPPSAPPSAPPSPPPPAATRPSLSSRSAAPSSAPHAAGPDLAREVALVDAADAALRRGDARAALASVRLHRAETANRGQLAEDIAAIEIEALCRLGDRVRVEAKLAAFDTRWPSSAQRSRLTTTCP